MQLDQGCARDCAPAYCAGARYPAGGSHRPPARLLHTAVKFAVSSRLMKAAIFDAKASCPAAAAQARQPQPGAAAGDGTGRHGAASVAASCLAGLLRQLPHVSC